MREIRILPRKESTPRAPRDLTDDQKNAANRAVSLIDAIAHERTESTAPRQRKGIAQILPLLDEQRLNHNVLIDGGRGSGKTSVLLSILKYWNHTALHKLGRGPVTEYIREFEHRVRGASEPPQAGGGGAFTDTQSGGGGREPIILPVPIIDLQPLASSTDLRLFLANSLRQVMDAISSPAPAQPKWAPDTSRWPSDATPDVHEAWEKFRDTAALGSDHIQQRRARLDTATYAVELEQAESSRQVSRAFGEFVDALLASTLRSELTRWGEYRPLFVVPIDDADMNPRLGAQLIETVNLLSHDSIAYLITGDTELFLLLLREHLAGGFRHSLRSVDLESDDTTDIGDLIHLRSLAHQIYDKHIPNAHRCRIDPLPGWERVRRLADSLGDVRGEFEPIPAHMDEISPSFHFRARAADPTSGTTRTLAYYFDMADEPVEPGMRTGATERFTDVALPETMRGLEDAREAIAAAGWRAGARANAGLSSMAEVVRYFWRDRINGSLLRGNDRRDLLDVVRLEEPELRSDEIDGRGVSTEKFAVQNTRLDREIIARTLISGEFGREHRWVLREILDYEFRLHEEARPRTPGRPGGLLLPSGVGAALILATDVAADLPTGTFIGKALSPEEFDSPFVVTSVFIREEGEYFDFPWPMPDWDSFRDFHIFSRAWAQVVSSPTRARREAEIRLDDLLLPFIALVAGVWYDRREPSDGLGQTDFRQILDQELDEPQRTPTPGRLSRLTKRIDEVLKGGPTHRRDQDFRHWYHNRLLLLAAPESGLSASTANLLYDQLMKTRPNSPRRKADFEEKARGARRARLNRARVGGGKEAGMPIHAFYTDLADTKLDQLLDQIDNGLRMSSRELFHYPERDRPARMKGTPSNGDPAPGVSARQTSAS